jgi:hypothetical protein
MYQPELNTELSDIKWNVKHCPEDVIDVERIVPENTFIKFSFSVPIPLYIDR